MYEDILLVWPVRFALAVMGFLYAESFMRHARLTRRRTFAAWCVLYFAGMTAIGAAEDAAGAGTLKSVPECLLFLALGELLLVRDRGRLLFVACSFTAGWEILRFTASPLAFLLSNAGGAALAYLANSAEFLTALGDGRAAAFFETAFSVLNYGVVISARLVQLLIFAAYLMGIDSGFVRKDHELGKGGVTFLLIPCVAALLTASAARLLVIPAGAGFPELVYSRAPATTLLLPAISLLLLWMIISSVKMFQHLIKSEEEERKRLLLESRVAEVRRGVDELRDVCADMRSLRHDLSAHMAGLMALAGDGAVDAAAVGEYVGRMTEAMDRASLPFETGNPVADIMLYQAERRARKNGVRFRADFISPEGADAYDLATILSNSLTNALEAAERSEGDRHVSLRSWRRGSLFLIETENSFSGEISVNPETGLPVTTKGDRRLHGIGLANIRRVARKYRGDIDFEAEGGLFRLTVMLCLEQKAARK